MKCDDPDCDKCKSFSESPQGKALADAYRESQRRRVSRVSRGQALASAYDKVFVKGLVPQNVLAKAKRPRRRNK